MSRSLHLRFLSTALALVSACSVPQSVPPPTSATRNVVDDLGRNVAVVPRPQRIISLAPNLTEIVFAIGAGDRLVANTSFCDYPPEATSKPRIGDTRRPDLERIVALQPDLVLVSTASQIQTLAGQLEGLGVPIYVSMAQDLDGVLASIKRIGDLLGETETANQLAGALRERIAAVHKRVSGLSPKEVFLVVGEEPLITTGKGTFADDLIRRAGGRSISEYESSEWPQYSPEAVIAAAPEFIILPTSSHGVDATDVPASLRETPAAREKHIVRIDADLLMRPGPRLVDGLEHLARSLHPKAFE